MFDLSRPCFTASSFLVNKQILNRLGKVVPAIAAIAVLGVCAASAAFLPVSAIAQTNQFGHFVYTAGGPPPSDELIYGYLINGASGVLTPLPNAPFSAGGGVMVVVAHPSGNFVYAATVGSSVAAFDVDPTTGGLTPISGSPYATGPSQGHAAGYPAFPLLTIDPSGKFLFVSNTVNGQMQEFSVDATSGALTFLSQISVPGVGALAAGPLGEYLYAMASTVITVYSIDPTSGALTLVQTAPGCGFGQMTIDSSGRFLYGFASRGISACQIDPSSGMLTPLSGSPFRTSVGFNYVATDPSGAFLYAVTGYVPGNPAGCVYGFTIDAATGALAAMQNSPFSLPNPNSGCDYVAGVGVEPHGKYAYVVQDGRGVASYSVNQATGELSLISNSFQGSNTDMVLAVGSTALWNPGVTWQTPAAIIHGTALSGAQLDASAGVPGTFAYSPAAGTVLGPGPQPLAVGFVPNDTAEFSTATAGVTLTVNKATPVITWPNPAAITYGTALSAAQLDAMAPTPGVFTYTPSAGTVLGAGSHPLSAAFAPTDTVDYLPASGANTLMVNQVPLTVTAANASRAYGAANPVFTASVAGAVNGDSFSASGSSLASRTSAVGTYAIVPSVAGATGNYSISFVNGTLTVTPAATLTVVVGTATRVYGAANPVMMGSVSGALNGDTFTVTGASTATATSPVGTYPITYTVTGANLADYTLTPATGTLTVTPATPTITWATPGAITYGTALSAAQLNATASTAGTFSYSPALGTVLGAGTQTLSVTFTPTDTTDYATPGAATVPLTVNKAVLAIAANSTARVYGAANPAFTGTVTGAVNGDAFTESFSTSATAASIVGGYPIVPSVAGANLADYNVTPTNGTLTVTQAGTATTFALSNSNLTMTAMVLSLTSGTPTGTVEFYQGQTLVGTGALTNGAANYTAATFPAGNVMVTAEYSGDVNFTQSASPPILVMTITPAETAITVGSAGSVSDALTLTAASGFTGTLQFSCGGLPADAMCSFSPASYTFTGSSNTASVTLTVETGVSAKGGAGPLTRPGLTEWVGVVCVPLFVMLGARKRPRVHLLMFVLLLGGVCGLVTACGSSAGASQSPAGTSVVQVVASGASEFQQTTSVTLTVQ
jgi:6-phosphogluconolactonase (cycloisomerase 2 family)